MLVLDVIVININMSNSLPYISNRSLCCEILIDLSLLSSTFSFPILLYPASGL